MKMPNQIQNPNSELLCILGGGLIRDENGKWHTMEYDKGGDKFGFSNDRWRVLAAAIHWKNNPGCVILASGGRGQYKSVKGAPTIASVIKSELIDFEVPENIISIEDNSNNTLEQLIEITRIAKKSNFKNIVLLTNEWHIPRVETFLKSRLYLPQEIGALNVKTVSAEEILIEDNPYKWSGIVEEVKLREDYKKRIEMEKLGVEDIEKGVYGKS